MVKLVKIPSVEADSVPTNTTIKTKKQIKKSKYTHAEESHSGIQDDHHPIIPDDIQTDHDHDDHQAHGADEEQEQVLFTDVNVNTTYENMNPRYSKEVRNEVEFKTGSQTKETTNVDNSDCDSPNKTLAKSITERIGSYIEEPWTLISSYFRGKHLEQLVRHQIESYNDMVNNQLRRTIDMFNPVRIVSDQDYDRPSQKHRLEVEVNFNNFYLYRPQIHENTGATKIMFPQEARLRNFTYASMMTTDLSIKFIVRTGPNLANIQTFHKQIPKVHIGKLPIMLKSCICVLSQHEHLDHNVTGECPHDAGGYFIINGSEKTVLGQERAAENKVSCYNVAKNNNKWLWVAEIKSIPDHKCISPKQINMMVVAKQNGFGHPLVIQIPRMKQPVPLFLVFRALGILSDKEICEYIVYNIDHSHSKQLLEALQASIIDANHIMTQEEAVKYITSQVIFTPINMDKETGAIKKREFAMEVLHNDLFPHCNTDQQRIYFLGYMAHKLLCAFFEIIKQDDRDSYLNKRIDLTGTLLNNLFRNYFNKVVKDMSKQVIREINTGSWRSTEDYLSIINDTNMYKIIKSATIENGLKRALSTGDFGIKSLTSNKVGVAQVLNRLTYSSSLSHLRRINTPIDKSGKLIPPRKLHNTSWGFLCPAETPEGGSIGVVKNISYMTHITIHSSPKSLHTHIDEHIQRIETLKPGDTFNEVKVFVNGIWVGITKDPVKLYQDFKMKKHCGIINIYTSVVFDYVNAEIRICNDAGRLARPLHIVNPETNDLYITHDIIKRLAKRELEWDDLLTHMCCDQADENMSMSSASSHKRAVIEYIDPDEQAFSMIAMRPKHLYRSEQEPANPYIYQYSHCEIHPSTIFGILASCIPFPEHNQAPRNTYQCAMGKQAIGIYVTNYARRMDKTAYVLTYPHRPLVDTRLMQMIELAEIPSGAPLIVAIMSYTGYNQEDSVLVNQGAIDRGMFSATIYHTEKDEDKKINGDEEIRCRPDPSKTKGMKFGNYDKINQRGIMPANTFIENRDIIMGKVIPIKDNRNDPTKIIKYEDVSRAYHTSEECYVDKSYIDSNGEGYCFCKVRVRAFRKPVIGDKVSSRMGQKGTIGNIIPERDMPFTKEGIRPDIIINPHAIPSRMTIGQLKETLLGKVLVNLGLFGDGTSFGDFDIKDISKELLKVGFEMNGNELLYNGLTGEQIKSDIFIGPVFYQRLKHMVNDKQHSRSIGPMVNFTHQPAEGRSRDGGLRFGEMERDAMVGHGASRFTRGRMYDSSDKYEVHVCRKCGLVAAYNDERSIHLCKTCDNRADFALVQIPYACKLLFQELATMNITPRIMT
jgi:DNA-directed RNA polymerase II subunit RPB2